MGELSDKKLAAKYCLPETTIKWRLNVSRRKIRDRMKLNSGGVKEMERIYKRINWETTTCNGAMNSSIYLSNQVARAICQAAYEKALTIEEISLATGLPTLYIEDALPNLIYGDAIEQINNKYATNFIILRLKDKERMEKEFYPLIRNITHYFQRLFDKFANETETMSFYEHNFGMKRLGYIGLPLALRKMVRDIKDSLPSLADGPYPPRKDGGYGWFIVEESEDENDVSGPYSSGCNIATGETGSIYYFHIGKYFSNNVYNNGGTRWLISKQIPQRCTKGVVPQGIMSEEDIIRLLQVNLIIKQDQGYGLNFPSFTQKEFAKFSKLFSIDDKELERVIKELLLSLKNSFLDFVPKRLSNQINQWISCFAHEINGYVIEELIAKDVLEQPERDKPLTNGVFYVEGKPVRV